MPGPKNATNKIDDGEGGCGDSCRARGMGPASGKAEALELHYAKGCGHGGRRGDEDVDASFRVEDSAMEAMTSADKSGISVMCADDLDLRGRLHRRRSGWRRRAIKERVNRVRCRRR
jgi:hypothetical protein